MDVVFVIDEGEMYTLGKVEAIGNHLLNDQQLLVRIPLFTGQLYSKDLVREAMEQLRTIWGEFGYIYADVQPIIKPDDKTHTVAITFKTDLGNCIRVNRVDIVGNNKTHDHVIRREILFDEGDILTTRLMDESKRRVMLLGYFDQKDGATWRTIKVDDEHADLELVVKEARTGKIEAQVGYGGQADLSSPTSGISFRTAIHDSNLRGTGTRYNISASYARQDKAFEMMLANDWLFDKPIYGSCDAYLRKLSYEEFNKTVEEPRERDIGGMLRTGFRVERLDYAQVGLALGEEDITYESPNIGRRVSDDPAVQLQFQETINRTFQSGDVLWLGGTMAQDFRDHPIYPSTGVNWLGDMKIGVPHNQHGFAFVKATANLHWYTPLIQDYGVVLHLHGFAGIVHQITQHSIPYRELFHLGGPASVRGFLFGQIGPSLMGSDLGGKKAFFVNAELQIPITADHNFSGVLFYDGGANWDTPNAGAIGKAFLQRNNFEYRHAVGFGLRLENPQPIQIEWGFKLDRKRRRHESAFEVHFGMSRPL
jgi:outer membrane protein insertion porin family